MLLGSVQPIWQFMWIVYIGLIGTLYAIRTLKGKTSYLKIRNTSGQRKWSILLFIMFILWSSLQSTYTDPRLCTDSFFPTECMPRFVSFNPQNSIKITLLFLAHFLLFWLVADDPNRNKYNFIIFRSIPIIATCYAVYGLAVYWGGNEYILWFPKERYVGALTSTFVNRNSFAAYLGIGVIISISLTLHMFSKRLPFGKKTDSRVTVSELFMTFSNSWHMILISLILLTALLLTGSRGGTISTILGLVCLVYLHTSNSRTTKLNRFAIIFVVLSLALFSGLNSGDLLSERLQQSNVINNERFEMYSTLLAAVKENLYTGTGLGTFKNVFPLFRGSNIETVFFRGHNDYLELVLTSGIIGSLLLLGALLLLFLSILAEARNGSRHCIVTFSSLAITVQIASHSLLDFPLQIPAVSFLYTMILALALSSSESTYT